MKEVAQNLVPDIHIGPAFFEDPFVTIGEMVSECHKNKGLIWSSFYKMHLAMRYEDCIEILKSDDFRYDPAIVNQVVSQHVGSASAEILAQEFFKVIGDWTPAQGVGSPYRAKLKPAMMTIFGPKNAEQLKNMIGRHLDAVIKAIKEKKVIDLVPLMDDFTAKFTADLVGLSHSEEDIQLLKQLPKTWNSVLLMPNDSIEDAKAVDEISKRLKARLAAVLEEKKKQPGQDMISGMYGHLSEFIDANPYKLFGPVSGTMFSSMEEIPALLLISLNRILKVKSETGAEIGERELPKAIEESLRLEPPLYATARAVAKDMIYKNVALKKNDLVLVFLGGANRDPSAFENPDQFNMERKSKVNHLTFGAGTHACAGAIISRMVGKTVLGRLFQEFPKMKLEAKVDWFPRVGFRAAQKMVVNIG